MKIDRVTYQKIFPLDAYVNQKVGFEASVDEGEDVNEVLDKLKEMAERWNISTGIAIYPRFSGEEHLPVIQSDFGPAPHYTIKNLKNNTNGEVEK